MKESKYNIGDIVKVEMGGLADSHTIGVVTSIVYNSCTGFVYNVEGVASQVLESDIIDIHEKAETILKSTDRVFYAVLAILFLLIIAL